MNVFTDPALTFKLRDHPAMLERLADFVSLYRLENQPALVLQMQSVSPCELNTNDLSIQGALRDGITARRGYWGGFQNPYQLKPAMHGVTSIFNPEKPKWAIEAHRDSHFIGGIFEFMERPDGGKVVRVIPEFFTHLIEDFFEMVSRLVPHIASSPKSFLATATLINGGNLAFLSKEDNFTTRYAVSGAPTEIVNLQLPIVAVELGTASWELGSTRLGEALCGAYFHPLPKD